MENQKLEFCSKYLKNLASMERLKQMYIDGHMSPSQENLFCESLDWWSYHYDGIYQVKKGIDSQELEIQILQLEI